MRRTYPGGQRSKPPGLVAGGRGHDAWMGRIDLDSLPVASTRIPLVRIAGDVTADDAGQLDTALAKAASRPPVILDLSAAGAIDERAGQALAGLVHRLGSARVAVVHPAAGAVPALAEATPAASAGAAAAALVDIVQLELANRLQVSAKPSAQGLTDFSGTDPGTVGFGDHRRDLGRLRG